MPTPTRSWRAPPRWPGAGPWAAQLAQAAAWTAPSHPARLVASAALRRPSSDAAAAARPAGTDSDQHDVERCSRRRAAAHRRCRPRCGSGPRWARWSKAPFVRESKRNCHLQVRCALSSPRRPTCTDMTEAHGGKAGNELRRAQGASGSQTFGLPCSDALMRTMLVLCTVLLSLSPE